MKLPYYTEKPEADEVQCALAWYTGAFADRERQLGVEILLDALLQCGGLVGFGGIAVLKALQSLLLHFWNAFSVRMVNVLQK